MVDRAGFDSHAWETTPLGHSSGWSRQLHFMCDFLMCSKQPMFLLWGQERSFIYNSAYQDIWGIASQDALGRPMEEVAGANWSVLEPQVEHVFAGKSFIQTDFPIAVSGQPPRYFDFSYTPVYDYETGKREVLGALCISTDVTARHMAVEELSESREALALTVDNVAEGVALVDSSLALLVWNEPFRRHFGYSRAQITTGMNAMDLMVETARRGDLGEGDPQAIVEALVHSIRSTPHQTLEIQRKNGRVLNLFRQSLSGGRFLLVSQDITDERTAARLKDELVSTVSHELRTPLTAIAGALGIVGAGAAGELSEKADRLIKIAQRNSERLILLVNDLLDVDKLQSGRIEFRLEEADLAELVQASIEHNLPYAQRGGLTLRAEVPQAPVPVCVDRHRMLQVLTNLISNAVKFSPEETEVLVRLEVEGRRARISVIDRGLGIPPEFRDRLFQRFSQHDSTRNRVQQGTGLGLAICKSIVEHHHGAIWLDTKTTQGTTIHVDLPLKPEVGGASGDGT